jgi:fatty acid desaturase
MVIVWRDISVTYVMLAFGLLLHGLAVAHFGNRTGLVLSIPAAVWLGYWLNSLICFMHEATHYNIHPRRRTNDCLVNWMICPFVGQDISVYRRVHWQHHLHLGDLQDPEVSYRNAPTLRFLIQTLTGIHVLKVLRYRQQVGRPSAPRNRMKERKLAGVALVRFLVLHGVIVGSACITGLHTTALAWGMAVFLLFPFFNTLMDIVEHRSFDAYIPRMGSGHFAAIIPTQDVGTRT